MGPGPESQAPVRGLGIRTSVAPAPVDPTSDGPTPVDQATTEEGPTTENQIPPQPPRPAGGPDGDPVTTPTGSGRRAAGTNPRAGRTNPRSEAELAEAARVEAEAAARRVQLERATETRRVADLTAQTEADQLEAEALALSGALDDSSLAAIVSAVADGLPGPLARSPMAVARAVVAWCRAAAGRHPGLLSEAVAAGLAGGLTVGEGPAAAPLALPGAPTGTASLRRRIGDLLHTAPPAGG